MGAGPDNEPLASPGNFFPGRKRRVADIFAELLGRSFLPFPHFAGVNHHIMRVVLSLDLDLAKFDQSCFHIISRCSAVSSSKARGRGPERSRMRSCLNSEDLDSLAPAHFGLSAQPIYVARTPGAPFASRAFDV